MNKIEKPDDVKTMMYPWFRYISVSNRNITDSFRTLSINFILIVQELPEGNYECRCVISPRRPS